jgi:Tol biopolymer transport system component
VQEEDEEGHEGAHEVQEEGKEAAPLNVNVAALISGLFLRHGDPVSRKRVLITTAMAALGSLGLASTSEAAFPVAVNGKVAYARYQDPNPSYDVWLANPDGSGQVNLTNTPTIGEGQPAFSPNGRTIAFSGCDDVQCDIFVMQADGSGRVRLTNTPTLNESYPTYSPDGRQLAFERDLMPGPGYFSDLFVINTDGSGEVHLTNTAGPTSEGSASYSPDGRRIAFHRCNNDSEICTISVINSDGSGFSTLTAGSGIGGEVVPSFSPDGGRIGFVRDYEVFVMNADGSGQINLTNTPMPGGQEGEPAFSPDGRLISFERFLPASVDIFTMTADGSSQINLTNTGLPDRPNEYASDWQYVYRCGGRPATIVGDDGPDKIKGTKRVDVIVANGGKDRVFGRGGRDRICGGKGRDKLIGGAGRKDLCSGGGGRDSGKGCETGKL